MTNTIEEAIRVFNLSPLEEYYLDSNNRIRARGFFYDEDTGIFINEFGLLDYELPVIEEGQERVRDILGFKVERPKQIFLNETMEFECIEEAVA